MDLFFTYTKKRRKRRRKYAFFSLYRSVVDLTSSRFQSPQVNCRAVDANSNKFTNNRKPTGPKKYASSSLSPTQYKQKNKKWKENGSDDDEDKSDKIKRKEKSERETSLIRNVFEWKCNAHLKESCKSHNQG